MKLARIGINGNEKPVLIDSEDNYRDLSSIIKDLDASTLNFETLEKIKKENIKNLPILDKMNQIIKENNVMKESSHYSKYYKRL